MQELRACRRLILPPGKDDPFAGKSPAGVLSALQHAASLRIVRGSVPPVDRTGSATLEVPRQGEEPGTIELDLERIVQLPQIDPDEAPDLTPLFARPGGTMVLWPVQSKALMHAQKAGGLLGVVGVGLGKTLVSFLLPSIVGSQRPLLLIPAAMREQCAADWERYGQHFYLPERLTIRTYESLSSPRRSPMLRVHYPDLIIADEAHKLRHPSSVRTRRITRYLRENPACRFVALSGTIVSRSICDYDHLCKWALGARSPLPNISFLLEEWRQVIDMEPPRKESLRWFVPIQVAMDTPDPRAAFQKRLLSTPGVIESHESGVRASLVLFTRNLSIPKKIAQMIRESEDSGYTPSGEVIVDAMGMSRVKRQLICGFYYYWDWSGKPWCGEPDMGWLKARKIWHLALRKALLLHSREGFDSPDLIIQACESDANVPQELTDAWQAWSDQRKKDPPPTKAYWISDYLIEDVADWAGRQKEPCIIWYTHLVFAARLQRKTGWEQFGAGPDASKRLLQVHQAIPAIISANAHGGGKNLQAWGNQILANPIASGSRMEQLLGRTHRSGQRRDEVFATVYIQGPFAVALDRALKDAQYIYETTGQRQRLCYAPIISEAAAKEGGRDNPDSPALQLTGMVLQNR